ncbi:hypothetical protein Ddc_09146 [Ditylenchus destructor]|nr:hypothetical protein Ddc_09146 [Ditylenchus destructor]
MTKNRIKLRVHDTELKENCTVKQSELISYISSVQSSRSDFYKSINDSNGSQLFSSFKLDIQTQWRKSKSSKYGLERWLGTSSIGMGVFTKGRRIITETKPDISEPPRSRGRPKKGEKLTTKYRDRKKAEKRSYKETLDTFVEEELEPSELEIIPIFGSKTFEFENEQSSSGMENFQVADIGKELLSDDQAARNGATSSHGPSKALFDAIKARKRQSYSSQILFCGGPVSALRTCPRRTSKGEELVAISTFTDEKTLSFCDDAAYVQFWTYPSDLSTKAKLEFLLEIPNVSAVLCLCWCPIFIEPTKDDNVLGYLAVGTNTGIISIYCVPKNLDSLQCIGQSSSDGVPLILNAEPVTILSQPNVLVRIPGDTDQEFFIRKTPKKMPQQSSDSVTFDAENLMDATNGTSEDQKDTFSDVNHFPVLNVDWSPFLNGRFIAAASASGRIIVWNMDSKEEPLVIYPAESSSPLVTIAWLNENHLCASFRNKLIRIFDVRGAGECIFEEETPRTCGSMVATCPSILPGFVSYDTFILTLFDIQYTCCMYMALVSEEDSKNHLVIPTFNCHQVQAFRTSICDMTGLTGSVGADGRLICALSGRLASHNQTNEHNFSLARTLLHLTSHYRKSDNPTLEQANGNASSSKLVKQEFQDDNTEPSKRKLCVSHNDCCAHKWLEVRIGDAALRDQTTMRRWRKKIPDTVLDRRLESLTSFEFSRLTPGLTICGGEAGLVFIVPSVL